MSTNTTQHPATTGIITLLVTTALLVLIQLYVAIPLVFIVGSELKADAAFSMSTSFSLCYAVGFLLWGPLADHYGRKRIMTVGLGCLTTATVACGFASSLVTLALLRGAQGLMAASFAPVALAYLAEATAPHRRGGAIGAMSTAFLVAGIAGQVFASAITLTWSWNWVFFISGSLLLLCTISIGFALVEPSNRRVQTHLSQRFAEVGRIAIRPAVILLSIAHITLLLSFVAMYTGLGQHLTELGLRPSQMIWLRLMGLPGMFLSLTASLLARRLGTVGVAQSGFGLATLGLLVESALSGSLIGLTIASVVFVAGVALAVPAMIGLYGEVAAPNRASGMALNGFILFLGASIGALATKVPVSFPLLLIILALLTTIAVVSLQGFSRKTLLGATAQ